MLLYLVVLWIKKICKYCAITLSQDGESEAVFLFLVVMTCKYSVFRSTLVLYRSILIMCQSILVTTDQI